MERLPEKLNLGERYNKGDDLVEFLGKLQRRIEDDVFRTLASKINWLLNRIEDNHVEIVHPDNSDVEQDGNWRIRNDGTDLKVERRESGSWVNKGGFTA